MYSLLPHPRLRHALYPYLLVALPTAFTYLPATVMPMLVIYRRGQGRLQASTLADPLPADGARLPDAFVEGPCLHARLSWSAPGSFFIGVMFRPGAFAQFADLPLAAIAGQQVPMAEVFGAGSNDCLARMADTADDGTALGILEDFLLARLQRSRQRPLMLPESLLLAGTAELVQRSGWSERQLQRLFHSHYGWPSRSFRRLVRFGVSLRGLLQPVAGEDSYAALAAASGYFDLAHMDHEFRALAGCSPARMRTRIAADPACWTFQAGPRS